MTQLLTGLDHDSPGNHACRYQSFKPGAVLMRLAD